MKKKTKTFFGGLVIGTIVGLFAGYLLLGTYVVNNLIG